MTTQEAKYSGKILLAVILSAGLISGVLAGYYVAALQAEGKDVLSTEERVALKTGYEVQKRELQNAHTRDIFQKRTTYQGIRDVYVPRKDHLDNHSDTWGTKCYPLPQEEMWRLRPWTLDHERRPTDYICAILRISPDERESVADAAWRAWVRLAHEEVKHVTIKKPEPKKVIIEIAPFPEEGKQIRAKLESELVKALGKDRAQFLLQNKHLFWGFAGERYLYFGQKPNRIEVFWSKDNKCWEMLTPKGWCSTISSTQVGRFYEHLTPEMQEFIDPRDIALPRLRDTEAHR